MVDHSKVRTTPKTPLKRNLKRKVEQNRSRRLGSRNRGRR